VSLNDTIRRAKSVLSDMVINEVSMVDAAANLRKWVVTKNEDGKMNEPAKKMTLKLPTAAKQALMDGLGQVIDKVTALASVVGDAETDDASAVPEELSTALKQVGEMISGMATQYAGAGTAAAGADQAPAATSGAPSEAQPPPNPNAGAPAGKSADPTAKALPSERHDGDNIKTLLHDGDSFKTLLHKTVGAAHVELAAFERLDKAGRKMAGARYKKLADLHDNLGKLLNELAYDESAEASGAAAAAAGEAEKAKKPPPPPEKKPAAEGVPAAKNETAPVAKSDETAVALAEAQATIKKMADALDTQGKRLAEVEKTAAAVSKVQGVSNAGSVDGPAPTPSTSVQWAPDMSEAISKRKANGTANGARK
jgi:hypothetical protein